jgi:hypothetical protein
MLDALPDATKGTWPSAGNPEDWWFDANHTWVSMGQPTNLLTGQVAARVLTAGPGLVRLPLSLGGTEAVFELQAAKITATVNGTPLPNVPPTPPALAAGLTVFQTLTANGAGQGLCGNITVRSLAQVPVPTSLATGGSTACGTCPGSHTYTACAAGQQVGVGCNSFLDVLVGGCTVLNCLAPVIVATQPDVPQSTTVVNLTLGANNHVSQNTAADTDAYSAFFTFSANRARITAQTCTLTADCQTGQLCSPGGLCQ